MSDAEQPVSPDEQVYQETKSDEPVLKTVYSNEEGTDATGDVGVQTRSDAALDDSLAQTFPTSDPQPTAPTTAATHVPESGDATAAE